jgi:hypothetical protein
METKELTQSELKQRLQSLYCIIDEGIRLGIKFESLEQCVEAYCEPNFIEPSHYQCTTFGEVAQLLLQEYRRFADYPNC